MKFLITGGCGFLGSNLASEVLRRGDELVILDNLSRAGGEQNLAWLQTLGDFSFFQKDVSDFNAVKEVINTHLPDVVFHLAGQVAMTTSIENPRKDFETNALGTFNVLEAVRMCVPEASIFYSSTNKVYGDLEWVEYEEGDTRYTAVNYPDGFPESMPLSFSSPYGCSKGSADQYMQDYHKVFGLKTVVFRHSSMYGGRQFATADQGWIGWFCEKAVDEKYGNGGVFTISGDGKQVRDLLHADDMTALYFAAVENMDVLAGKVFNIGGGMKFSLSLLELFALLEKKLNVALRYEKLPWRKSDQKVFVADIKSIFELTGWQPKVNPEIGVGKMLDWVTKNYGNK
ncbi:GDP-mannose 4,6-dehydratase [Candidatus Nomurabacteria bacterium]|nr:GDP-mannose 4,6-dehydratase [Candidatus Nomurabacteria bacterium]